MQTTRDTLPNGLILTQPKKGFRYGTDAVLLAAFARGFAREKVIDLGTGTGVLPLLMAPKTHCTFIGVEIQQEMATLAVQNVAENALQKRIQIICGDYRTCLVPAQASAVICNPPYFTTASGKPSTTAAQSKHEISANLSEVLQAADGVLSPGGRLYLIHDAARLTDIFSGMQARGLTPKRMTLVHGFVHQPPNRVLIEAVKHGKSGLAIGTPFVLWQSQRVYTPQAAAVYHGEWIK